MSDFTIVDSGGRVICTGVSAGERPTPPEPGAIVLPERCSDPAAFYYDAVSGELVGKQVYPLTLEVAGLTATLHALPVGAVITVGADTIVADSEPTELMFDAPGEYSVRITGPVAYFPDTLEVTIG